MSYLAAFLFLHMCCDIILFDLSFVCLFLSFSLIVMAVCFNLCVSVTTLYVLNLVFILIFCMIRF